MTRLYEVKSRLNLRAGPGTDQEILEILSQGQLLYPVEGWLPVVLEDGGIGWVSARYVEEVEEEIELEPQPIPAEGDPPWMAVARSQLGVSEIAGPAANQQILNFFMATSFKPSRGDEDPWCSGFACWCMERAGYKSPRNALAISWKDWGKSIDPRPGAVVVFPHHVGFYAGLRDDGRIDLLGGNQSNTVNISPYSTANILGYRWPA